MSYTNIQKEFTKPTATVIGKGFIVEAARFTCTDSESIRVDGTIIGDIDIDGVLIISETGHIGGNIAAGSTRVAGCVLGSIQCRSAVHLAATAEVKGDINASVFIIDEGAVIIGSCQTQVNEMPLISNA